MLNVFFVMNHAILFVQYIGSYNVIVRYTPLVVNYLFVEMHGMLC